MQGTITLGAPFLIHMKVSFTSLENNPESKDKGSKDETCLVLKSALPKLLEGGELWAVFTGEISEETTSSSLVTLDP